MSGSMSRPMSQISHNALYHVYAHGLTPLAFTGHRSFCLCNVTPFSVDPVLIMNIRNICYRIVDGAHDAEACR